MGQPVVTIKGLDEFKRELKKLAGKEFAEGLKDEHQKVAKRVVAASQRRARMTGRAEIVKAAASLTAGRTMKGAIVRGGGARIPWAGAAMFGAYHDRPRPGRSGSYLGWNQFLVPQRGGYVIYPAIRDERRNIEREYLEGIDRLMRRAFPD